MAEPFSRIVRIDALPRDGQTLDIEANAAERQELAALFKLPSIEALTATLTVKRTSNGGARVTGDRPWRTDPGLRGLARSFSCDDRRRGRRAVRAEGKEDKRDPKEAESFSIADEDEPDPLSTARSISAPWRPSSLRWASIPIRASPASSSKGLRRLKRASRLSRRS